MSSDRITICGGVISFSEFKRLVEKDAWACMMEIILPDDKYNKWLQLMKEKRYKEADRIVRRYGRNQID
jgi:hypothetical protein